jgi:FKBP-type peptidyl-prolyl cis-trans isomerase (trigger factor)
MLNIKINKLPKSEIEIEGEIPVEVFEQFFLEALSKIKETAEVDGFRKGKVPENILLEKIPEIKILEEAAELALAEHYPKIIEDQKLDVISRPEIAITKLARNNPLGFKIKTSTVPEVKLPDYKTLAKKTKDGLTDKEKEVVVTEEDIENTIMDIRKSRAPKKHVSEAKEGEETEEELPPWDDEFVKSLGDFVDIADFRKKLEENLKLEKGNLVREKTRLKIIEKIIEDSEIDVPDILIELEIDKILYRMEADITQMGLKFEDYLKHLNKTVDELRGEFKNDGEKRAKLALVLNEISKAEQLLADEEEVAKEVAHILEHYKDADPERARLHSQNILTNEKIFQFLENI